MRLSASAKLRPANAPLAGLVKTTDGAANSARLSASTEAMSGFGAPLRTNSRIVIRAKSVMALGVSLPWPREVVKHNSRRDHHIGNLTSTNAVAEWLN